MALKKKDWVRIFFREKVNSIINRKKEDCDSRIRKLLQASLILRLSRLVIKGSMLFIIP